ncbi:MAG: trypsin-like peptidase domain-containing protein, partial [Oscillospiraceae bacterium]|nr:trypsin-like peptidase domain-containing protein [Oscillospiraceae bacterium]
MSDNFENNYYNNNYNDGSNNDENSVNDNTNNNSYNSAGVNSSASYNSEGANTSESNTESFTPQNENAQNTAYDGNYHYKGSQIPTDESFSANYNSYNNTAGGYSQNSYSSQNTAQNSYTGNQYGNGTQSYGTPNYGTPYSAQYGTPQTNQQVKTKQRKKKAPKPKKEKKPVTRGAIAAILVVSIVCSAALGFGGGYAATKLFGGGLTVNQSTTSTTDTAATASRTNTGGLSTTDIVNKTADSVVEITTETVTTGSFFQQYVAQGAGSGVIISNDGYILTNNHVIDGANTIKVTLRDSTEYDAKVIGAESQLDVALLKVDAKDLSPATFGDSST